MNATFIICAPILYVGQSNGILSLLKLAQELELSGAKTYFVCILSEAPDEELLLTPTTQPIFDPVKWNELVVQVQKCAEDLAIQLLLDTSQVDLDKAYVIYPERIINNPLHAPKVIRYFGNKDGVLNGGINVNIGANDFILTHSSATHPNPHFKLFFAYVNPVFNDIDAPDFEARNKNLTYCGKGEMYGPVGVVSGTELLTRYHPPTKDGLADLLKNARFLFTWDCWSNITVEAIFCGAIPVLLNTLPFSEEEIDRSELGPLPRMRMDQLGLSNATNNIEILDPAEIMNFKKNRLLMIERVERFNLDYSNNVKLLLDTVIHHFS